MKGKGIEHMEYQVLEWHNTKTRKNVWVAQYRFPHHNGQWQVVRKEYADKIDALTAIEGIMVATHWRMR